MDFNDDGHNSGSGPGYFGNTVTSWDTGRRALVKRIRDENPGRSDGDLALIYFKELKRPENDSIHESVVTHSFMNDMNALRDAEARQERAPLDPAVCARRHATVQRVAAAINVDHRKARIMDLAIGNSKLGDLTGKQLRKLGGNFARLAQLVPPTKRVRDVLTEEQIINDKLWKM